MKKSTKHFTTNQKPMVILITKCPDRWLDGWGDVFVKVMKEAPPLFLCQMLWH
jgi:hypothetical protein